MTAPFLFVPVFRAFDAAGAPLAGGLLYTYGAGGTTNKNTYSDAAGAVPNANPVVLDSSGSATVRLEPGSYHFVLTDSTGSTTYWDEDYYTAPYLTQADVGGLLFPQTSYEIAAGVTPTNYAYPAGDARRYGYIADNGVTDNTLAIQNALDANAGFTQVYIPAGGYGAITGTLTGRNVPIFMEEGSELRWTATTADGPSWLGAPSRPGIQILDDNFKIKGHGKLTGPSSGSYVANEFCLIRVGTSATSRGVGFEVQDVEISGWGSYGIGLQFVEDIHIENTKIHDCGYHGMAFLSCLHGIVHANKVYSITPGTSSNAYGISCSHDSTSYSSDANASSAPRQTTNPFCIDFDISFNEIYDIPLWIGIDAHGLFDSKVHHNTVYNCLNAIQIAGSSGDAANYAGENNEITDNVIYATQRDGTATTVANGGAASTGYQYGITVNGGSTIYHRRVSVARNMIIGVGNKSGGTAFAIQATYVQDCVIADNIIATCYGDAIYGAYFSGNINGNRFGAPGQAASSRAIYLAGNNGRVTINSNVHDTHGGNAYATGVDMSSTGAVRVVVNGNDFDYATTPYTATLRQYTRGASDVIPYISDSTTGSHTVDVSVAGAAPVINIQFNPASNATITDFGTPAFLGQLLVIDLLSNITLTIDNTGSAIKCAAGSISLAQFGTVSFKSVSLTGYKWAQASSVVANS